MIVHLRAHSHFSFLEGLASPGELALAASQAGMPALALTDHRSLTGAIQFYEACRAQSVKPVLGIELEFSAPAGFPSGDPPGMLALLAMDRAGWSALCRLGSSLSATLVAEGDEAAPVAASSSDSLAHTLLENDNAGLICLSGGSGGLAWRWLEQGLEHQSKRYLAYLSEIFGDRLYIELNTCRPGDRKICLRLASLARSLKRGCVAVHPIYWLQPGGDDLQRLVSAIRTNRPLAGLPESACAPPGSRFLSPTEIEEAFRDFPGALDRTAEVAGRCALELPLGEPHYPQADLPRGVIPELALRREAESGAQKLYGALTPQIQARLEHELQVISNSGYASLFLIMQEIMRFAAESGIPTSSRGSAASSLVAHCLGITTPDPLRLNLYFERFLNPARATPPDIDTDLCSRRRDEVIHFVYRRFGQQRVAMVCTINRFRRRSALREVGKAHGLPKTQIREMVSSLPQRWWGPPFDKPGAEDPFEALRSRYPGDPFALIFDQATKILGLPRHVSIHPGGVVIAPEAITDLVPVQLAPKGIRITQLDLTDVERLGLIKIDLLGIRGLTVLGDVSAAIAADRATPARTPVQALEGIPTQDEATSEMLRLGRTIGCFQIESPGMRATLREIQATSIDDLMAALALYRPGPLTGGLKSQFVERFRARHSPRPYEPLHPALQPLLADTYGVILYQEQVLRIAHELAGLSLADADLLRRAMSHFDPGKAMQTLQEKFVTGAYRVSGVPEETAARVWEMMAAFAGYGFPKAHAASYALIGWRAAWCKVHYPALFMAAVLANWGGYYSQRVYLTEARRLGLRLRPPHVNYARSEFSVSYLDNEPVLFMGLDQVRDLTRRTQARILKERPFHSLSDFLVRVDPRPPEALYLVQIGALDGFGTIPLMLSQIERGGWRGRQMSLFDMGTAAQEEEWPLEKRLEAQDRILGSWLDAHPLDLAAGRIAAARSISTLEAASVQPGQAVRVAGMRQTWRRTRTGKGDEVYRMALEDLEGMLDVHIPAAVYRRARSALSESGPYLITGVIEIERSTGEAVLIAERIERL